MIKLMGNAIGIALTATLTYAAQKQVHEALNKDEHLESMQIVPRLATSFATVVIVGGLITKVIHSVFK